jgi:hypothetical protein
MMRLRRATLLVAFSLLTSATTASAECAWVLWMQVALSTGGPDQLTPLHAHPSKTVCDQAKLQAQRVRATRNVKLELSLDSTTPQIVSLGTNRLPAGREAAPGIAGRT